MSTIGIHKEIWEIKKKTWLPDLPGLPVHYGDVWPSLVSSGNGRRTCRSVLFRRSLQALVDDSREAVALLEHAISYLWGTQPAFACRHRGSIDNCLIDSRLELIAEVARAVQFLNHPEVDQVFPGIDDPRHARRSCPPIRTHRRSKAHSLRLNLQAEAEAGVAEERVANEELLVREAGQVVLRHEFHGLARQKADTVDLAVV